jgi:hypothetical protein
MNKEILKQYDLVKEDFLKRFPNTSYTTITTIWDDGDFTITTQHGDENSTLHCVEYYSGRGTIEYTTDNRVGIGAIKRDYDGREYYIPSELVKYLNKKTNKTLNV